MFKSLIAAAVVAVGAFSMSGAADAKTRVNIDIGIGAPGYYPEYYEPEPRYYYEPVPVYRPAPVHRVSCGGAARMLRNHGYRRIEPQDCSGRRYSFIAWRRGEPFVISVSARSGRIIGRSRL